MKFGGIFMMSVLTFIFASGVYAQCTGGDGCDEINPTISAPKIINNGDVICFTNNVSITGSVTIYSGGILRLCNGTRLNSNQSIAVFPGGSIELYGCARLGVVGSFTDFYDVAVESWCLNCNTNAYPIDTAIQVYGSEILTGWICNAVLPVDLLSFDVFLKNYSVELSWSTASEINNDYFSVMRSSDGIHWKSISFIDGSGTRNQISTYHFTDEHPETGVNYYKLIQVDFDGAAAESPVRYITNKGVDLFTLKSNVIENAALQLNIKGDKEMLLTVSDALGRILYSHEADPEISSTLTIVLGTYSENGVYYLSAVSGDQRQTSIFIMK
jgi:hypothetical protein